MADTDLTCGSEAHRSAGRMPRSLPLAARRLLWFAAALIVGCQPSAEAPTFAGTAQGPQPSLTSPSTITEVTTAASDSTALALAELETSPPPEWLRNAKSRRPFTPSVPATDAVDSEAGDDEADDHAEAPPCGEIAFPADTGEELVGESFDSSADGSLHIGGPDPAPATDGQHKIVALYLPSHPRDPRELLIVQTNGDGRAVMHSVRLVPTENLHPLLRSSSVAGEIVVTPERWFIPVTVTTYLDPSQLIPGDVDRRAIDVHDIYEYGREPLQPPGIALDGYYYDADDEGAPVPFKCFVSWAQMGVTSEQFSELFSEYAYDLVEHESGFTMYGMYHNPGRTSGHILTAPWGEEPVRVQLPINRGNCCTIDVLDTGFVAIPNVVPPGRYRWPDLAPPVHYSSDGITWEVVDLPTHYVGHQPGEPRWEVPIWVCSAESTDSGSVIIREAHFSFDGCSDFAYWTADGDLTNWRKLLAPPPGYD